MLLHYVIVLCYYTTCMLLYYVIILCYCTMLLYYVICMQATLRANIAGDEVSTMVSTSDLSITDGNVSSIPVCMSW